ncbi:hypothetical protein Tco_1296813 [Tanacetum coccineum]
MWPESVLMAVYLNNRIPSALLSGKTMLNNNDKFAARSDKFTSQPEEVVTKSPIRPSNSSPDDLGNSGASTNGDDATMYDDEYKSEGEDFVDFNHLFDSDQSNIPDIVYVTERKDLYSTCMMCCRVGSII